MDQKSIALLTTGDGNPEKNDRFNERFGALVHAFREKGFAVSAYFYLPQQSDSIFETLVHHNGVLVWVNPGEGGSERELLDPLLRRLSSAGCFVSAHPDAIEKIGTKNILMETRAMEWGCDVCRYARFEEFREEFPISLQKNGTRILKLLKGNGGNAIYKVSSIPGDTSIVSVINAKTPAERRVPLARFIDEWRSYFDGGKVLIDQEWIPQLVNGMVRCYVSGSRVCGFGYQEINALYPAASRFSTESPAPGSRCYFTEECGLFQDLRYAMEQRWIPQMAELCSLDAGMLPVIWDVDFFIDPAAVTDGEKKYTLCEINASSVSPYPPSAVPYIVEETSQRI